jgi:hypothetical protein
MEDNMNKDELIENLKSGELTISFTKKDGTQRVMHCTLDPEIVPQTTGNSVRPDNIVTVWDTEKQGWRSINLETGNLQVIANEPTWS